MQYVKIQYSIDVEEIPSKISELMSGTEQKMGDCSNKLSEINKSLREMKERVDVLKNIDDLRHSLYQLDLRLGDCYSMLRGYHIETLKDAVPEQEQPQQSYEDINRAPSSIEPNPKLEELLNQRVAESVEAQMQKQADRMEAQWEAAQQSYAEAQKQTADQMPDDFKPGMSGQLSGKEALMHSVMNKMMAGQIELPDPSKKENKK